MYLGIDIGGTSLKAGLVDSKGNIIASEHMPVARDEKDFEGYLVRSIAGLCRRLMDREKIEKKDVPYVGAGVPGPVDSENGVLLHAPNLPVSYMRIGEMFGREFAVPLVLGNDANCAALGEYIAGGGKEYGSMMLLTLGTGVGSGFVHNGKLWAGCNGIGTEAGHVIIHAGGRLCGCGRRGCLEAYASASALIRDTVDQMLLYRESRLWEEAGNTLDYVDGTTPFRAAEKGDVPAKEVIDQYIDHLAEGLLNIINMLQPDCICLGGGVSSAGDRQFLHPLRERLKGRGMDKYNRRHTQIVKAKLGNNAGIIGAAMQKADK